VGLREKSILKNQNPGGMDGDVESNFSEGDRICLANTSAGPVKIVDIGRTLATVTWLDDVGMMQSLDVPLADLARATAAPPDAD
jgi:hypothetical protein